MGRYTAIVTGATGAIGTAIARQILRTGQYHVIVIARDESRGEGLIHNPSFKNACPATRKDYGTS